MQSFSIAVLVRKMIDIFFEYVDKKGLSWFEYRMKIGHNKIIKFLQQRRTYKKQNKTVHMYGQEWVEEHISMVFSKNFNLLGVEIMKRLIE